MAQPAVFNRKLVSREEAVLPADARALALGEACFETLRVYPGGKVLGFRQHLDRLMRGLTQLGFDPQYHAQAFHPDTAAAELLQLIDQCGLSETGARVRIQAGRADCSGIRADAPPVFFCMMMAAAFEPQSRAVALHAGDFRRIPPDAWDASVKWSFYQPAVQALRTAHNAGFDDTLFWDAAGNLACGALSNIFLISGSAVSTPSLESGALHGITRGLICEALADAGIPVQERHHSPADVQSAEALFLTSSLREIAPVARLGKRKKAVNHPMLQRVCTVFETYRNQNLNPLHKL
ncbi:branched chain amino acid aminotransferase apoenzyme [Cyclonatronum proteinivorum]|uniref:branched-chain-amino-acid transaminase n=1 Tax=Cyclonatronum proteinivorum TaxID=1457365 RepID=A0A345UK15_9BACT|nr:aminotransferase class IV [Cyclonatronum proteinivorum]AXJ00817.1 branched chain amino acid aminotransferase apoenzyme [Cyclonatronum proteinivorum]